MLSGGELPAMVLIDAVVRQLPGVLGDAARRWKTRLSVVCWIARTTPARRFARARRCRRCCCPATTKNSSLAAQTVAGPNRRRRPDLLAHRVLSAEETQLLTEISGEEQCGE